MRLLSLCTLCASFIITPLAAELSAPRLLIINGGAVRAEIADTVELRRLGLSHRRHLAADAAMLLVFSPPRDFCLWMREVYFGLDAAFVDENGIIIGIAHMQPQTENLHCAPRAAKYALEINAGWLRQHRVKIGAKIHGLSPPKRR